MHLTLCLLAVSLVLAGCTTRNPNYQPGDDGSAGHELGACTPSCGGKQCGSDGCGGTCGTCKPGSSCDVASGRCVAGCKPSCGIRTCGPDGCGGSCGECPTTSFCSALGVCEPTCAPKCEGRQCGPDGCGGACGTCPPPAVCEAVKGICQGTCVPDCNNKECGPDACGGECGQCPPPNSQCSDGQCVTISPGCGLITFKGCCDGQTLKYCQQNKVVTEDCKQNPQCGWNNTQKFYDCGTTGQTAPSNNPPKACP